MYRMSPEVQSTGRSEGAFSSDNIFVIHSFQYNAEESGKIEIMVGQLKTIKFSEVFDDAPQIYLTATSPNPSGCDADAVAGNISKSQFTIFSSGTPSVGWTKRFDWGARGNRNSETTPIWRKLISNSKNHQFRRDFRAELVDLESAFEVFVDEYLAQALKSKLKDETVEWILGRSIEEKLKVGFTELKGQSLSKLHPVAHGRWQRDAKEVRDSVVHRGVSVSPEQAEKAREAVFDLITLVDFTTLDHLGMAMTTIPIDGPTRTFGTVTIKAGTQSVQMRHGLSGVPSNVSVEIKTSTDEFAVDKISTDTSPHDVYANCKTCGAEFAVGIRTNPRSFATSVFQGNIHKCPNGHADSYDKKDYALRKI